MISECYEWHSAKGVIWHLSTFSDFPPWPIGFTHAYSQADMASHFGGPRSSRGWHTWIWIWIWICMCDKNTPSILICSRICNGQAHRLPPVTAPIPLESHPHPQPSNLAWAVAIMGRGSQIKSSASAGRDYAFWQLTFRPPGGTNRNMATLVVIYGQCYWENIRNWD